MARNVLTAAQVARRLGVKVETIYAYVSRGLLERTLSADGRTSRFDTSDVESLARRGRPRRERDRQGVVDVSLATAITGIEKGHLVFRGHSAVDLARGSTFEAVAELLWTGALPETAEWSAPLEKMAMAVAAVSALPESAAATDRLFVATAALGAAYPMRVDLRPPVVMEHARALLTCYAAVLPAVGAAREARTHAQPLASKLYPLVSPLPATTARVALVDAALVLLADHELATSTLAARVAASTRADPFAVVLAGLGAVSGPLHGKAAVRAQRMILDARESSAEAAIAKAIETWGAVPGCGHPMYEGMDPRAACLLERLSSVAKPSALAVIDAVARQSRKSSGAEPNVDFALAAVAFALSMPVGATVAIFAIARTAGFIAHALEEYGETPLRFRAKSIYIGASAK